VLIGENVYSADDCPVTALIRVSTRKRLARHDRPRAARFIPTLFRIRRLNSNLIGERHRRC
jgi:hypothetical protein